jgi:hypothetical protein
MNPDDLFQLSIGGPIGVAGFTVTDKATDSSTLHIHFQVNPAMYVSLRVFEFFRLTVGAGYMLVIEDVPDIGNCSCPIMSIQARFGGF